MSGIYSEEAIWQIRRTLGTNGYGTYKGKDAYVVSVMGRMSATFVSTAGLFSSGVRYYDILDQALITTTPGRYNDLPTGTSAPLYIVSDSANDSAAGTGARTVKAAYLDATGALMTVDATLTGTTPVNLGVTARAVNTIFLMTAGSLGAAAGTITVQTASGGGVALEKVFAGRKRSLSCRYRIPVGWKGYIVDWSVSCSTALPISVHLEAQSTPVLNVGNDVFLEKSLIQFPVSGGEISRDIPMFVVPGGMAAKISFVPTGNINLVAASLDLDADFCIVVIRD